MKRYMVLYGTRPEAIKLCPLILALRRQPWVQLQVVSSGQHRDMPRSVLRYFGVTPDVDLGLMQRGQTPAAFTQRLMAALMPLLTDATTAPDVCLVHGDTTTAFVGALCCFYAGIPVVHVEAGLRTYDVRAPYPEEFNRHAIDVMSDVLLAPTEAAAQHLYDEGCAPQRVHVVGNTATDALRLCLQRDYRHPLLCSTEGKRLVLLTLHRRELPTTTREDILRAVRETIEERDDVQLLYPVHPSPTAQQTASILQGCPNAQCVPPLELPLFQHLLARSTLLLTDSGGLQEEACYLGIPTLVLRDCTERPEGIAAGVLHLAGTNPCHIRRLMSELLDDERVRESMRRPSFVYGDGHVSERIVQTLQQYDVGMAHGGI